MFIFGGSGVAEVVSLVGSIVVGTFGGSVALLASPPWSAIPRSFMTFGRPLPNVS